MRVSRRIGFGLAVLGMVSLVVLEAAARFRPRTPQSIVDTDDDLTNSIHDLVGGTLSFVPRPSSFRAPFYRINSRGVRGEEFPLEKPRGEFRIVVLGDSVGFGVGLPPDTTFASQLETILEPHVREGVRIRCINAGVNGYNTLQEAAFLRTRAAAFHPDLVLVLGTQNDLGSPTIIERRGGKLVGVSYPPRMFPVPVGPAGAPLEWLGRHSALAEWLLSRGLPWLANRGGGASVRLRAVDIEPDFEMALGSIVERARRIGAWTFATVLPYVGVDESEERRVRRETILGALATVGIPHVDLRPIFREFPPADLKLVPEDDLHLNPLGIYLAAAVTASDLAERSILPLATPPPRLRGWKEAKGIEKLRLACGLALADERALQSIVNAAESKADEAVTEVGLGMVTPACSVHFPQVEKEAPGRQGSNPMLPDIAAPAFTRLVFYLGGKFSHFRAETFVAGAEKEPTAEIPVRFRVVADNREVFVSEIPGGAAVAEAPLGGADVLTLETVPAGDESFGAPAVWREPVARR